MKKNGFTLVELLAAIVILGVIMTIAVPNVITTLENSRKDNYISDAKKFLSLVKSKVGSTIQKPDSDEILKVTLGCVDNGDVMEDPEGNDYDLDNSFVIVVKKNGELVYYVHLVAYNEAKTGNKGVYLVEKEDLDEIDARKHVRNDIALPTVSDIKNITGVNGIIRSCTD